MNNDKVCQAEMIMGKKSDWNMHESKVWMIPILIANIAFPYANIPQ